MPQTDRTPTAPDFLTVKVRIPGEKGKPMSHLTWAERIARGVAKDGKWHKHSVETEEIIGAAHLMLVQCANDYDPEKAPPGASVDDSFRKYAHIRIRGECINESRRHRAGGTNGVKAENVREIRVESLTYVSANESDELADEDRTAKREAAGEHLESLFAASDLTRGELTALRALRGIGREPAEPAEVAAELGVTVARVAEMEAAALAKLQVAAGVDAEPVRKAA